MADIEWITLNTTAGTGNSAVTYSVPAWTGNTDRSVRLTVAVPGSMLSDTVTVTQRGSGDTGPVDGDFYIIVRELSDSGTDGIVYAMNDDKPRTMFEYSVDGGAWQYVAEGGQLSITPTLLNIPIYIGILSPEVSLPDLPEVGWLRFENIENMEVGGSTSSADKTWHNGWYSPLYSDSPGPYKAINKADNLLIDSTICNGGLSYSSISAPPSFPNTDTTLLCSGLFSGCTSLLDGPTFPATTTGDFSAANSFEDCTSLTGAPVLPTAVGGQNIHCDNMFRDCTSLKVGPTLPHYAIDSENPFFYGTSYMYSGCTALTEGSAFPDEVGGGLHAAGMYVNCISLVRVPPLPNKVGGTFTANFMFSGCTSLTDGPSLPSIIGDAAAIKRMYYGCSSLTGASINFPLSIIKEDSYSYGEVFTGVNPTGVLKVRADETMSDDDIRTKVALPSGWTIQRVL